MEVPRRRWGDGQPQLQDVHREDLAAPNLVPAWNVYLTETLDELASRKEGLRAWHKDLVDKQDAKLGCSFGDPDELVVAVEDEAETEGEQAES